MIPQKKAVFATAENVKTFESKRAELEKNAAQIYAKAEQRAAKLQDITLVITAQASDEGKLYGSIGVNELKEAFAAKSLDVSKREIMMPDGAFQSIGQFSVDIQVHSDLVVAVQVEIVPGK